MGLLRNLAQQFFVNTESFQCLRIREHRRLSVYNALLRTYTALNVYAKAAI